MQNNLPPGGQVFQQINMPWRNLIEGHTRNIPSNLFGNQYDTFRQEDLSFLYCHIRKNQPPDGYILGVENLLCFFLSVAMKTELCMDQKDLKGFWWRYWQDSFCEVSSQLTHSLQIKRCWRTTDDGHRTRGYHNNLFVLRWGNKRAMRPWNRSPENGLFKT